MSRLYYEGQGSGDRLYYEPWTPKNISRKAWEHTAKVFDSFSGTWQGSYVYVDAVGQVTDSHLSRLELRRTGRKWQQLNTYTWENGGERRFEFAGEFDDNGVLVFNTPRLVGKAWVSGQSVLLDWEYQTGITNANFERINMIGSNAAGQATRMRSWQLSESGTPKGHVLIHEVQISDKCCYDQ